MILLIDFANALWRAKYSFKSEDKPYVMVYNFFRNLKPIVEQFKPSTLYLVKEGRAKNKYSSYPEYKANRADKINVWREMEPDIKKILEILACLPTKLVQHPDLESDDTIAHIAHRHADEKITIVSNDTDFIQLLQRDIPNLSIWSPIKKKFMEAPSYNYLRWKILAGDKVDNIAKILTAKKAEKLTIDDAAFEEWMKNEDNAKAYEFNRNLIQLIGKDDLPGLIEENGIKDWNKVKDIFKELDMPSMIEEKYWTKFVAAFETIGDI